MTFGDFSLLQLHQIPRPKNLPYEELNAQIQLTNGTKIRASINFDNMTFNVFFWEFYDRIVGIGFSAKSPGANIKPFNLWQSQVSSRLFYNLLNHIQLDQPQQLELMLRDRDQAAIINSYLAT
jgi:hypothetical protein